MERASIKPVAAPTYGPGIPGIEGGSGKPDEKTTAQVIGVVGTMFAQDMLWPLMARHYYTYRKMRTDPTIAFARMLGVSPLVAAGWTYEQKRTAPKGALELITDMFEPLRMRYVKSALEGHIDYGWQGFEIVQHVTDDGYNGIRKVKPLLQDRTQILVDPATGSFSGLRQWNVFLYADNFECVNVVLDLEGTNWYGIPLMENARELYAKYITIEDAAARYDKKIAGSHWVIHYPIGSSIINGVKVDNFIVAQGIINALQASGAVTVPTKLVPYEDDTGKGDDAWKIELIGDNSAGRANFTERQKYLDALKVRALGLPERSVLEGQFGTKAEADAHGDFAILNMELRHAQVTDVANRDLINRVLVMNYGPSAKGTVYAQPIPLSDTKTAVIKEVYKSILANADTGAAEWNDIDTHALRDQIGIPSKEKQDLEETTPVEYGMMKLSQLPQRNGVLYHEARLTIEDGDLLLFRRPSLIAWAGRGEYSHAAMAAWWGDVLMILELMEWKGGRAISFSSQVHQRPDATIDVYKPRATKKQRGDALAAMKRKAGEPYAARNIYKMAFQRSLLSYFFPIPADRDEVVPTRHPEVCSQAISSAWRLGAGIDPVPNCSDAETEPMDLARCQFFDYALTVVKDISNADARNPSIAAADRNRQSGGATE